MALPKALRNRTLRKTLAAEHKLDARIRSFVDISTSGPPVEPVWCSTCHQSPAARFWPDPAPSYLCAACRRLAEQQHPMWSQERYPVSCRHCGTHHAGRGPWLHLPHSLPPHLAICFACTPAPHLPPLTPPPPLLKVPPPPAHCMACLCSLSESKRYRRQYFTLCHACYDASRDPATFSYALARQQLRQAGFLPFSFQELTLHDSLLLSILRRLTPPPLPHPPLSPYQVSHILAFLHHHTVTRSHLPPPATWNVLCAAKSIATLPTSTPPPPISAHHPFECPHGLLTIPCPHRRLTHILLDCPARTGFHPTRPPDSSLH